jgi:hypothetical protein
MERIVERPGALDVHKASVTACVRLWQGRELQERMAEFATQVPDHEQLDAARQPAARSQRP